MDFPLPESLDALNLPPLARSILREALAAARAAGLAPTDHAAGDYVAFVPHPEHWVAVYVKRFEFSIVLDQGAADQTCRTHPSLTLERKSAGGAAYVHAAYDAIASNGLRAVVVDLIAAAFARSAALGPQAAGRRGPAQGAERVVPTCRIHHLQLAANGRCDYCDD